MQAFCKPRGLKTNIARLVRTAEVTADVSRARAARCARLGLRIKSDHKRERRRILNKDEPDCAVALTVLRTHRRNRSSAANAMEAARMALLSLAKGVPEAPSPKPAAAAAATTAAVAPKPAAAAAAAAKPAAAAASAVAAAKPAAAVATPKPAATAATREPVETPQRPSASAPQSDSVKNMEAGKKVDGAGESSPSQPAAPPPAERSAKDVAKDAGKAAKAVAAAKKKWEREEAERIAEEEMPMVHDEGWPTMRAFLKEVFSKQVCVRTPTHVRGCAERVGRSARARSWFAGCCTGCYGTSVVLFRRTPICSHVCRGGPSTPTAAPHPRASPCGNPRLLRVQSPAQVPNRQVRGSVGS